MRIPHLVSGCDPSSLEIGPVEGFLLSRIDGQTPWSVLREMGGMAPEQVDRCLEDWLATGLIRVAPETPPARECEDSDSTADPRLDVGLDLGLDAQRRILEFEAQLDRPYHALLGVSLDADGRALKRAYFGLSKEFHPDRYFRRDIGDYAQRLDRIFKAVLEAYELLSDPTTREEIQRSLDAAPPAPARSPSAADGAPVTSPLERLRQRMPFRIPEALRAERRRKAAHFFDAARFSFENCQYLEAASSLRLAVAFDPQNAEYRSRFGEIQAKASAARAAALLEQAEALDDGQRKEALRLLEETLLYRPHDPEVNHKASQIALSLGEIDRALEYAERCIEHSPEVCRYYLARARVYAAKRELGYAVRDTEHALERDGDDPDALKLLATLRPRHSALQRKTR